MHQILRSDILITLNIRNRDTVNIATLSQLNSYIDKLHNQLEAAQMIESQQNTLIDALIAENQRLHILLDNGRDINETKQECRTANRSIVSVRHKTSSNH